MASGWRNKAAHIFWLEAQTRWKHEIERGATTWRDDTAQIQPIGSQRSRHDGFHFCTTII
jgi:hypothetical protein